MPATPMPSAAELRDAQAFDAVQWALSRPGLPRALPQAGAAQLAQTLLDRECQVYAADPDMAAAVAQAGAVAAAAHEADHLFLGRFSDATVLQDVRRGSDLYPDDGATVVLDARIGEGPAVRLSGPGVEGALDLRLGSLPDGFWQIRNGCMRYPMGFECLFLDGAQIVGVPRSTTVEVL